MSLAAKLRPSFTADDRKSPRTRMLLEGAARQQGGAFSDITIHDLSRDGFRVESAMDLSPGMTVEVDIPGVGVRDATVMWAGHPYAGCAFVAPLLREQVRTAREESPVVWGPFGDPADNPVQARTPDQSLSDLVIVDAEPKLIERKRLPLSTRMRAIIAIDIVLWLAVVAIAWAIFG